MSEIKVEKDVEMPRLQGAGRPKYPWHHMAIGDSFFAADRKPSDMNVPPSVRLKGWKFSTRSWKTGKQSGVRVWRIE